MTPPCALCDGSRVVRICPACTRLMDIELLDDICGELNGLDFESPEHVIEHLRGRLEALRARSVAVDPVDGIGQKDATRA